MVVNSNDGGSCSILIAGASGVVGRTLIQLLGEQGYSICCLTHQQRTDAQDPSGSGLRWESWKPSTDPDAMELRRLAALINRHSVVINLAGASLADGRLDKTHQARLVKSRLDATTTLTAAAKLADHPPMVWVQASAVGYYGHTGEARIDEAAPCGSLFLSTLCHRWEGAIAELPKSTRVAILRIGLVLDPTAPAWQKLLLPIKLGIAGPLGSGQQWIAWIDADDLGSIVCWILRSPTAQGIYNATAPEPIRQVELVKTTAKRLHRPAILRAPAFGLRLLLGRVADELLLASCRAIPKRLQDDGFQFRYTSFDQSLPRLVA